MALPERLAKLLSSLCPKDTNKVKDVPATMISVDRIANALDKMSPKGEKEEVRGYYGSRRLITITAFHRKVRFEIMCPVPFPPRDE